MAVMKDAYASIKLNIGYAGECDLIVAVCSMKADQGRTEAAG